MEWMRYNYQDSFSPIMEELIFFNDSVLMVLIFIISVVGCMGFMLIKSNIVDLNFIESQITEYLWILTPSLVLIFLCIPSLLLLYTLESGSGSCLTLKAIGHQWYWSYEYSDFWFSNSSSFEFDSYMLDIKDLVNDGFRLLDVDNRLVLPFNTQIQMLVTSLDVIHSWSIPSLGIKVDAVPGRLNEMHFFGYKSGIVYGQCSEICGANHSFMPIVIEFINMSDFLSWIKLNL